MDRKFILQVIENDEVMDTFYFRSLRQMAEHVPIPYHVLREQLLDGAYLQLRYPRKKVVELGKKFRVLTNTEFQDEINNYFENIKLV